MNDSLTQPINRQAFSLNNRGFPSKSTYQVVTVLQSSLNAHFSFLSARISESYDRPIPPNFLRQ